MSRKGKLFVISGPSGTGKGTVIKKLFEKRKDLCLSVSATSRGMRDGEVDGVNYYFLTKEKFESEIENGAFLEHACFCGNYYGTPRKYVEEKLEEGMNVMLEIEVKGALQVKEALPEAVSVFIMPPSEEELENRLKGRGTESDEVIAQRLETAKWEMSMADKYDYRIVNDVVETAVEDIEKILDSRE